MRRVARESGVAMEKTASDGRMNEAALRATLVAKTAFERRGPRSEHSPN